MHKRLNWVIALLSSNRAPYIAALISLILCLPALRMGFFADDYVQRAIFLQPPELEGLFGDPIADFFTFADGDPERMERLRDLGVYSWMSHDDARIRFWRPVTVATHWLDYLLWPNSPLLMHIQSLLWFGGLVVVAGLFYRRMMGPGLVAGLAVLLFAIDDAHGWPAAWIANRNAPIALLLCIFVLTLHDRWRRDGRGSAAIAGPVIFLIALLAKESSISTSGYLFAYALFIDKASPRSRALSLSPYAIIVVVWRMVYVRLGYGVSGSSGYIDPALEPAQFLFALTQRIPVLMQGQWWLPPSDYYSIGPPALQPYFVALGLGGLIVLIALLLPLLRNDAAARFWFVGMSIALLPIAAGSPQDRLLMFPGLGAMGLLAQWFVAFKNGALFDQRTLIRKWFARPAFYVLVAVHFVIAPVGLTAGIVLLTWINDNSIMAAQKSLPHGPEIVDTTFIFINANNYPIGSYLFIVRGLDGRPVPAHVRSLARESMTAVPTTVTRVDDRSLTATPEGGYNLSLFRDANHMLQIGDKVELTGLTIEVLSLNDNGWPKSVRYTFEKPLEDPSYLWFVVEGVEMVRATVPAIGETKTYQPKPMRVF